MGVPEITQVELLMDRETGRDGLAVQLEMVPVVAGTCIAATSTVSTTEPGEKDRVGLEIRALRFKVAVFDPVLFVAVMV